MVGFAAFIDESGCDGFNFNSGASDFLVIGAVVCRTINVPQFDHAASRIAELCAPKKPNWRPPSFKKLNGSPSKRWVISREMANTKCQVVGVAIHKPSLSEDDWQENKQDLYFYGSKLLLQRVSWACRDAQKAQPETDPRVTFQFSQKGHLRYEHFRSYVETLKSDPAKYRFTADWAHIDPNLVDKTPHDDRNAFHTATDHFCSALGAALEYKEHGHLEDRFVRLWKDRFYSSKTRVIQNGLKFWPPEAIPALKKEKRGEWVDVAFRWK